MTRPFRSLSRVLPALVIALSTAAMLGVSHDAMAKRLGGGGSVGRQSSNVTQRQATPPAAPRQAPQQGVPAAAPAAAGAAATAGAARSGMSRWLGPIAGIAAGLGLAALLSHLGLGAAAAEFIGTLLLIALVAFAILFIVRRMRGGSQPAMQGAGQGANISRFEPLTPRRDAAPAAPAAAPAAAVSAAPVTGGEATGEWGIPSDFDTANFLQHAKAHFVRLQGVWDRGDVAEMRELVTDDLLAELSQQISQRQGTDVTEVVLLNAELLGIEKVSDGHLASVRYSGMLREAVGAEAFRFEEVWNLFKPQQGGWLLAGVQQVPVQQ